MIPLLWLALPAHAVAPVTLSCAVQASNVLRYDCEATTTAPSRVRVRFWEPGDADQTSTGWTPTGTSHAMALWGMKAGHTYRAFAEAYDPATGALTRSALVDLAVGVPTDPPFDQLTIRAATRPGGTATVDYLAFPVTCTGLEALVIVDRDGDVVWYDGLPAGGRSATALEALPRGDGLIVQTDRRRLAELRFDGTVPRTLDMAPSGECNGGQGPCGHHEVRVEGGATWVGVAVEDAWSHGPLGLSGCAGKARYAIDGLRRYDAAWSTSQDWWIDDLGYAPDADAGPSFDPAVPNPGCNSAYWDGVLGSPTAPIDVHHLNAFDIEPGPVAYVSLTDWSQVVKLDLATNTVLWTLHATDPAYSSFATPLAANPAIVANAARQFTGQHHVQWDGTHLLMLDNNGSVFTRAIRVLLDEAAATATLDEVYTLVDDDGGTWASPSGMGCSNRGSAHRLASGNILASCPSSGAAMELDVADGTITAGPLWYLEATCATGGTGGFYRTVPLSGLGL